MEGCLTVSVLCYSRLHHLAKVISLFSVIFISAAPHDTHPKSLTVFHINRSTNDDSFTICQNRKTRHATRCHCKLF